MRDEIGKKYNRLTIVSIIEHENKSKCTVKCDCGNVKILTLANVLNSHTRSCGCLLKEILRIRNHSKFGIKTTRYGALFSSIRKSYRSKGKGFSLSDDQLFKLLTENCHYCGEPPSNSQKDAKRMHQGKFIYSGIDRVDNEIGYTIENTVSCCKRCNVAKNNMNIDDFIRLCHNIVQRHSIK